MARKRETRREPRFPLVLAVNYPGARGEVRDYTENLSAGGLFIRTDRSFLEGDRVGLVLSFPGLLEQRELEVEVLRSRAGGPEGPAGVAVVVPHEAYGSRRLLEDLARAAATPGSAPYRLLLVEDNPLVVAMYTAALKRLAELEGPGGLAVEVATDAEQAGDRLHRLPHVDMVVTDVHLPTRSGLDLLEQIRSEPRLARTPVIVISAGAGEERSRAVSLGAQLFLQKPVRCQDIVGTIRALLAVKGRASRAP